MELNQKFINFVIIIIIHLSSISVEHSIELFESLTKRRMLTTIQLITNKKQNQNSIRKCMEEIYSSQNNQKIKSIGGIEGEEEIFIMKERKNTNNKKDSQLQVNQIDSAFSTYKKDSNVSINSKRSNYQKDFTFENIDGFDSLKVNLRQKDGKNVSFGGSSIENSYKVESKKGERQNKVDKKPSNLSINKVSNFSNNKQNTKYSLFSNKLSENSIALDNNDASLLLNDNAKNIDDLKLLADSEIDDIQSISFNIISQMKDITIVKPINLPEEKSSIFIDELVKSFYSSHNSNIVHNKITLIFRLCEDLDYCYNLNKSIVKMIVNTLINKSIDDTINTESNEIIVNFKKQSNEEMCFFNDFCTVGKLLESNFYLCISVVSGGSSLDKAEFASCALKDILNCDLTNGEAELPACKDLAIAIDSILLFNRIDKISTNFTLCIPVLNQIRRSSKIQYDIYQTTTELKFNEIDNANRHLCSSIIFFDINNKGFLIYKMLKVNSVPHVVFDTRQELLKQINEQQFNLCIKCPKIIVMFIDSDDTYTLNSIRLIDIDSRMKIFLLGTKQSNNNQDKEMEEYNENILLQIQTNFIKENEGLIEDQELKMSGLVLDINDKVEKPVTRFDKALSLAKMNRVEAVNKAKERQIKKYSDFV